MESGQKQTNAFSPLFGFNSPFFSNVPEQKSKFKPRVCATNPRRGYPLIVARKKQNLKKSPKISNAPKRQKQNFGCPGRERRTPIWFLISDH